MPMDEGSNEGPRILVYILRRDLRLHDNPIFATEVANAFSSGCGDHSGSEPGSKVGSGTGSGAAAQRYTHLLPLYIFPAQHVETSGFLRESVPGQADVRSPYPPARSELAGYWRCGPHRAKFLTESVWDLKKSLRDIGSDLVIRAGLVQDVVRDALEWYSSNGEGSKKARIVGVWMTKDETIEERREERALESLLKDRGVEFKTFRDEKYYVDE